MHENYKKRLTPKQLFSIPNILTYFRIMLIPAIMVSFLSFKKYVVSAILVVISGITDVIDGFIARRFNMITDFGKFIDPLADKLTQLALAACLISQYIWITVLLALMVIKELLLFTWGMKVFHAQDKLNSSKWFGKACTVFIYGSLFLMFLGPIISLSSTVAYLLIGFACLFVIISTLQYGMFYKKELSITNIENVNDKAA